MNDCMCIHENQIQKRSSCFRLCNSLIISCLFGRYTSFMCGHIVMIIIFQTNEDVQRHPTKRMLTYPYVPSNNHPSNNLSACSTYGSVRFKPIREDVTCITAFLIGGDFAQRYMENKWRSNHDPGSWRLLTVSHICGSEGKRIFW